MEAQVIQQGEFVTVSQDDAGKFWIADTATGKAVEFPVEERYAYEDENKPGEWVVVGADSPEIESSIRSDVLYNDRELFGKFFPTEYAMWEARVRANRRRNAYPLHGRSMDW